MDQDSRWVAMAMTLVLQIGFISAMTSWDMSLLRRERIISKPTVLILPSVTSPNEDVADHRTRESWPLAEPRREPIVEPLPSRPLQELERDPKDRPSPARSVSHPQESDQYSKSEASASPPSEPPVPHVHPMKADRQGAQEIQPAGSSKTNRPVLPTEGYPSFLSQKNERPGATMAQVPQEESLPVNPDRPLVNSPPSIDKPAIIAAFTHRIESMKYYPYLARKRGMEGTVLLSVYLDKSGELKEVGVKSSSGYEILDRSAVDLVRKACPFLHGYETGFTIELPITYKLTR